MVLQPRINMIVSTVVIVLFALKDNKFSDSNALSLSFISLMRVKMQFHILFDMHKIVTFVRNFKNLGNFFGLSALYFWRNHSRN